MTLIASLVVARYALPQGRWEIVATRVENDGTISLRVPRPIFARADLRWDNR